MLKPLFNSTALFERLLKSSENHTSISKHAYKGLLKKLNQSPWNFDSSSNNMNIYYNSDDCITVINIEDERLSNLIYLALEKNVEIPIKVKFVTLSRKGPCVFAVISGKYHSSTSYYYLTQMAKRAEDFCETISSDECKVYIDYHAMFMRATSIDWLVAMFKSIVYEPVTLTQDAKNTIFSILLTASKSPYVYTQIWQEQIELSNIKGNIQNSHLPFYSWLRKGIYHKIAPGRPEGIPFELGINLFRFLLDDTCISNIHDFYTYDEPFSPYGNDNFIICEKRFSESLFYTSEDNNFILYEDTNGNRFAKIKDDSKFYELSCYLQNMCDKELIDVQTLLSCSAGSYIFFYGITTYKTLRKKIKEIARSKSSIFKLIHALYDWEQYNSGLKNLRFQDNVDYLECFSMTARETHPSLTNPLAVSLDDNKGKPLDCKLVMLMVMKEYMHLRDIFVDKIYSSGITNIFHPCFTQALIKYVETGVYEGNLPDEIFNGCSESQVMFVDELAITPEVVSKLTFYKDYTPSNELAEAIKKQRDLAKANGFIPLDDFSIEFNSRLLNETNVINTFFNSTITKNAPLMIPEKVIISKDVTKNGNYKVIGILWNHDSLVNAIDVIKSKKWDCKDVYNFIYNLLAYAVHAGFTIMNAPLTSTSFLVDTKTSFPVFWEPSLNYSQYACDDVDLNSYYSYIIAFLTSSADFSVNYDVFSFSVLMPNRRMSSAISQLDRIRVSLGGMAKCKYNNHWYVDNGLCPICQNVFEIKGIFLDAGPIAYTDEVTEIMQDSDKVLYRLKPSRQTSTYLKEVRLGLENNLFDNYVGLKPLKLVLDAFRDITNIISYSNCNLSNIMSLETFKHIQRLKVVLVMYKKLLPHILDGSFICPNRKIFETMVMHKDFKGEILIPNLPLMECSVILSDDTTLKNARIEETKRIFSKFLVNYIMADDFLANGVNDNVNKIVAIVDDIKQFNFSSSVIKDCIDIYGNYCLTHNMPFASSRAFCPECVKNGINAHNAIFNDREYFKKLESSSAAYDGGEANIYPYDDTNVQKIFKSQVDFAFKSRILAKALEKNPLIQEFNESHEDIKIISASKILYMQEGNTIQLKGFVQEFIRDADKISSLRDKDFVSSHGYAKKDIVEILIKVCKGIEFLHSIGGFIGDLNGGNILVKNKAVYIIDIDGMSFDDVKNCVYTNMYIYPPSAENNNITKQDDWYSLAVQSFYYLTYSHPFRGICNEKKVPVDETKRMKLKLSLLGNHRIIPPSICIGWDFLPTYLLEYFLNTFEGDKRESMLEVLEAYHSYLVKCESMFSELPRKRSVSRNINEDAYIDSNYMLVYKENEVIHIPSFRNICTNPHGILVVINNNFSYFYDTITEKGLCALNKGYDGAISIHNGNIYHTRSNGCELWVDSIDAGTKTLASHAITKRSNCPIVSLKVAETNKFVFVERNDTRKTYDIYCNSTKMHYLPQDNFSSSINIRILYDDLSQNWLVLFVDKDETVGVVIDKTTQSASEFKLQKSVSASVCFYRNTLYYVGNGNIHFYNINTKSHKSIDCKYATVNSNIFRRDNKFVIMNEKSVYVFEKS